MKSRWENIKTQAIDLRKNGHSIKDVEARLGIARSTLSGWFKNVEMGDSHLAQLQKKSEKAWISARVNARLWHRAQKAARVQQAWKDAQEVMDRLTVNNDILDLAFAMLYLGEGAKSENTSLASSDPKILRLTLVALENVYGLHRQNVKCDLHLRMDQDEIKIRQYWSNQLMIPVKNFRKTSFDKRSSGRATYDHYKGVCVLSCGNIAIQRKLIALYNLFYEKVVFA